MVILLPGDTDSPEEHPIYARSGWRIPQERPQPIDGRLIRTRAEELQRWRPNIALRSLSNYPYNCVGLVFASRRAWIEIDHVYKILEEDGYYRVRRDEVVSGDVVVYKDQKNMPRHVALIVTIERYKTLNIRVISKWGQDAEFIHYLEDLVPQLGEPTEFYTDRIIR